MHRLRVLAIVAGVASLHIVSCAQILGIGDWPPVASRDASASGDERPIASDDASASGAADAGRYASVILADDPILYYRLDESTGPAMNLGSAGGSGTYGPLITRGAPGIGSNDGDLAAIFPGNVGTGAIVSTPESKSLEPLDEITVECWANAPSYDNARIVSYGSDDGAQAYEAWVLQIVDDAPNFYSGALRDSSQQPGPEIRGQTRLAGGVTYHLAATYDGKQLLLYVNGALDPVGGLAATGVLGNYDTTNGLGIGGGFGERPELQFRGTLDEVAVYPKALSAERLRAHVSAAR